MNQQLRNAHEEARRTAVIRIPEATRDLIRTLAAQGHTNRAIAKQTGVSHRTVRHIRQHAGLPLERPPWTAAQLAQAHQLLQDGASYTEAATTFGHSRHRLIQEFPGHTWTRQQAAQHQLLRRRHRDLVASIDAINITHVSDGNEAERG